MKHSMCSAVAWLLPTLLLGGCSFLLEPDDQCSVDADCGNSSVLVCQSGLCVTAQNDGGVLESTDPYVLSYFTSNQSLSSDSLHLAFSTDGLHWTTLNNGAPAYQLADMGSNHIRDPFILRKQDGTFVYIATDWTLSENDANYWNNPSSSIVIADSTDLITFTNPRRLEVTQLSGPGGSEMHAWAPEAFFDPDRQEYGIIWSGNDVNGANRIYVSYTVDFQTLVNPVPEVFYDPGYPAIDGTIVSHGGRNYLFFKDESDNNGGALTGTGKDIQIARSPSASLAAGSFVRWDIDYVTRGFSQSMRRATEGPLVIKVPNQNIWFMCADFFTQSGSFGCWRTTDLDGDPNTWTELPADQFRFPSNARHASIVRVRQTELDALIAHYGVQKEYQIRTLYTESSKTFYVAHTPDRTFIAPLDDRSAGTVGGDFAWHVVPGLANPDDPDLVSFEAVGSPGHYIRIDSTNPNRYPACDSGQNRADALCWAGASERHHYGFLDPYEDSATFRSDATFRRVAARNGNATMSSFQWHGDATRYLRHMVYNVFATTASTGVPMFDNDFNIDSSFAIEER